MSASTGLPPVQAMATRVVRVPPPAGTKLLPLADLPDGVCIEWQPTPPLRAAGLLLLRQGEQVQAYINLCPHFVLPLNSPGSGFLMAGPGNVMCVHHCAVFRCSDGLCIEGPAAGRSLPTVPVVVLDGAVHVAA
ncbi:MAG: Rieske 2Fe-2S domain-containing protein [Proteobacteria bacterium]|nr:Rieske 2Fe-2S domain-containing protein [Pseudomonadota bacterium]